MKRARMVLVLMSGCVMLLGRLSSAADPAINKTDKTFVTDAAQGGMLEVKLGQLAGDHAQNAKVKEFGQKMVTDHSKANDQLLGIAKQKNITILPELEAKYQKEYDRFAKLSGAEFDKEYMSMMVKDHTKDVKEFEKESAKGEDPAIKLFAASTLPTIREHLQLARETAAAIGLKVPELKDEKAGTSGATGTTGSNPAKDEPKK